MRNRFCAIGMAATLFAVMFAAGPAAAARWGEFKRDGCVAVGKRQYSSRLWDIHGDWTRACQTAAATVRGQRFKRPSRCRNLGGGGMWGEFDVNDASCKARWGEAKRDSCVRPGVRQYSARLWDIPGDWNHACRVSRASVAGQSVLPARCVNKRAGGMWGEFDVADASCPFWGNEAGKPGVVKAECVALNLRKYYARLWDVSAGVDWFEACRAEPETVAGYSTPRPSACISKGPAGMWGEWLVKDAACTEATLPEDARRRTLAMGKLAELGDVIAARIGFAQGVGSDPKVRASLRNGDAGQVARTVDTGGAGPDGYLLRTLTIGATAGGKLLIFGVQGEAGAAIDLKGRRPVYAYASAGYDWGPGLAAGGGINVGFWVCQNNKIGGDVWGLQFGADDLVKLAAQRPSLGKGASVAIGLWFDYDNVFQGFTLTPGVGVGANFGGLVRASTAVDGDETVQCDGRKK